MRKRYRPPRLLEAGDVVDDFECGSAEQTEWLRHHARQAHAAGTAKVLVVTPVDSHAVVAYYAWSMASISIGDTPPRVRKGAGRYPQPVALLARLGVSFEHEGQGLGAGLLADAIGRTARLRESWHIDGRPDGSKATLSAALAHPGRIHGWLSPER